MVPVVKWRESRAGVVGHDLPVGQRWKGRNSHRPPPDPAIRDSAWCLFRAPVKDKRQDKIVLVQLRDSADLGTRQRYKSEKAREGYSSWRHEKITIDPVNPDFELIVRTDTDKAEPQVIAELIEMMGG